MGWRTVVDVRDHSKATGPAYVVAIMLAERAPDENRIARPGIELLARDSRVAKRTAQRALKHLEELGEIERITEGRRGQAAEFYIAVGAKGDGEAPNGGKGDSQGVKGDTGDTPTKGTEGLSSLSETADAGTTNNHTLGGGATPRHALFALWLRETKRDPKRTKRTPARMKALDARLKDSTEPEIEQAIRNCAASEWHMKNGHTDLTLICRSRDKLEYFRDKPPPDRRRFDYDRPDDPENDPKW